MKFVVVFFILCLLTITNTIATYLLSPVIYTTTGPIQGITLPNSYAYLGIPYSGQPLRFSPPFPHPPWTDILNTSTYSAGCIEYSIENTKENKTIVQDSEYNCLTLNIYMPFTYIEGNPILFYIHGGGFVIGNGNMDMSYIANQTGSLLVSINYRLGTTGFLNLPGMSPSYPIPNNNSDIACANVGILDQQYALQWINQNAGAFNHANKSNILIFGQSAGGSSVLFHLTIPSSYSLYQSAVPMSPGSPVLSFEEAQLIGTNIANALNCSNTTGYNEQLHCLRNIDIQTLISTSLEIAGTNYLPARLGPSVDNTLVLQPHVIAILQGNFNRNAYIVTTGCLFEGDLLVYNYNYEVSMNKSSAYNALLEYGNIAGFNLSTTIKMGNLYTNISINDGYLNSTSRIWGDGLIACAVSATAKGIAKYSNKPHYRLLWNTTLNQLQSSQPIGRSTHGTDYVFYFLSNEFFTESEQIVQQNLFTWLVSLAVNRDVNANGPRGQFPIQWPIYSDTLNNTLLVVNEIGNYSFITTWQEEYCNIWWEVQP